MPPAGSNEIGARGESLFSAAILKPHATKGTLFIPSYLGEKFPLLDFVVQLLGNWTVRRPFFFVQAKSTTEGYTAKEGRIKVKVDLAKLRPLMGFKAPVYIAGIDAESERIFLVSARARGLRRLSSMHTAFELNDTTRETLFDEVSAYWRDTATSKAWSSLRESRWSYK